MITRDIIRMREVRGVASPQVYQYGIQDKYIMYKKNNLNKFLRSNLLHGVPSLFLTPSVKSASSSKAYIAVNKDGERIYKENKPVEAEGVEVEHFPDGTHFFSQLCLESQGFICNKWKCHDENPRFTYAMNQHKNVQDFFMYTGFAEAVEIPVWSLDTEETGFIDILCFWNGKLFILDYKPQARSAKNKHTVAQLKKYKELLGPLIGEENIGLAYFDEKDTYILV